MALFDRETDPAKERDGVPLDFGEFRVTLRRAGGANEAYELELDKALKPHRPQMRHGVFPQSKMNEVVFDVFARIVVVKWETKQSSMRKLAPGEQDAWLDGIDMRGKLVPATVENLVALFHKLPGVFLDIQAAARGEDLFRVELREDDAKN